MEESSYSSKMERELEEAFRKEKVRLDQLHDEVGQLSKMAVGGSRYRKVIALAAVLVVLILFGSLTWVMMSDESSRALWPFLLLVLLLPAAIKYLRPR